MPLNAEQSRKMRMLLWKWGNTLYFVQQKERELSSLRGLIDDAYDTLGAAKMDGMPNETAKQSSSVENSMAAVQNRISEYERAQGIIQASITKALALKEAIDDAVEVLDPVMQKILRMRYVDDHQWAYIAIMSCYDEGHVRKKEREAVEKLTTRIKFLLSE